MTESRMCRAAAAVAISLCWLGGCSRQTAQPPPQASAPVVTPATPEGGTHVVVGTVPAARGGMAAIVILEPQTPRDFPPQAETPFMDQISQTFFPAVLFVRTGHGGNSQVRHPLPGRLFAREEATREGMFNVAIPTGQV